MKLLASLVRRSRLFQADVGHEEVQHAAGVRADEDVTAGNRTRLEDLQVNLRWVLEHLIAGLHFAIVEADGSHLLDQACARAA